MTDLLDRLKTALADRYSVERELGHGGMAVVYLARDVKHDRQVAIKVLRPELAASLGAERFLREIQISAQLSHPNILTLIDSGEAAGLLYYVMPFVEGESLRERLQREKQLPIEEALQLTKEIAEGLGHAHALGIIHRDIKPENVMLESGHAVVTDFGIARAVTAAGGEKLTETGIAVGTPTYMSPEQAMGIGEADARSDVYALAVVLYEMLSGDPPFTGTTPQALLARKATEPPPRLRTVRRTISDPLEAVVIRALETTPADRYSTVGQFVEALEGVAIVRPSVVRHFRRAQWWGTLRESWVWLTVVLAVISGSVVTWTALRGGAPTAVDYQLDPNLFAIMPFTASEGVTIPIAAIPQYVTAAVTGWDSVRVADVTETARQVALVAESDGNDAPIALTAARVQKAHRYVTGTVAQAGERVTVTGAMYAAQDGQMTAQADAQGPADSLAEIAQLVFLQLLAVDEGSRMWKGGPRWGLAPDRLDQLKGRRLDAVESYVRSMRETCCPQGSLEWADRAREALRYDSSFALAALEAFLTGEGDTALARLAWDMRGDLSLRDRALLEAVATRRRERTTVREQMDLWERARRLAPSDPTVAFEFAEDILFTGPIAGNRNWYRDYLDVFLTYVKERPHYIVVGYEYESWKLAAVAGDSTWFPRYRAALSGLNADSMTKRLAERPYGQWAERAARGEWTIAELEAQVAGWSADSLGWGPLFRVLETAVFSGRGLGDIERLVPVLQRKNELALSALLRERGRHDEWRPLRDSLYERYGPETAARMRTIDFSATGEPEAAASLDTIDRFYSAQLRDQSGSNPERDPIPHCYRAQLRLTRGSTAGVAEAVRALSAAGRQAADSPTPFIASVCGPLLALERALVVGEPAAEPAQRLTEILQDPPMLGGPVYSYWWIVWQANLELARVWRQLGEPRQALEAVRRQPPQFNNLGYLNESLRLEALLLVQLGDTAQARRVYDHYLKLRPERPEYAPWAATWDSVKAEYAAVGGR